MDSVERRLIELNDALIQICLKGKEAIPFAQQAMNNVRTSLSNSRDNYIVTSDDDININFNCNNNTTNPDDPQQPPECNCCIQNTIIYEPEENPNEIYNYSLSASTYYLGIRNAYGPTNVILPEASNELNKCPVKIIKLEMGPPIGTRRVTISSSDGALIDGQSDYILQTPYECVTLIHSGDDWFVI